MTAAALNTLINFYCSTNDTTFTQANKLVLVNAVKDDLASQIEQKDADFFMIPSTFDLVANQREYPIGDDMLNRIHRLDLKFATSDTIRYPSRGISNYQGSETESEVVAAYSNYQNGFAHTIRRRAIFILSGTIPNVTAGGRLWLKIYPANLANLTENTTAMEVDPTTTSFGFPRQFHELLARKVAIIFKGSQPKPIPLSPFEAAYGADLLAALNSISMRDNSEEIISQLPADADMYDNGFYL